MAIVIRSHGHILSEGGFRFHTEHSIIRSDYSFSNSSSSRADLGDLGGVKERPSIMQKLIHNMISRMPFSVRQYLCNSHANEIISSRHDMNSQLEDIEGCDLLIPVESFQTRFAYLPDHHEINWSEGCGGEGE